MSWCVSSSSWRISTTSSSSRMLMGALTIESNASAAFFRGWLWLSGRWPYPRNANQRLGHHKSRVRRVGDAFTCCQQVEGRRFGSSRSAHAMAAATSRRSTRRPPRDPRHEGDNQDRECRYGNHRNPSQATKQMSAPRPVIGRLGSSPSFGRVLVPTLPACQADDQPNRSAQQLAARATPTASARSDPRRIPSAGPQGQGGQGDAEDHNQSGGRRGDIRGHSESQTHTPPSAAAHARPGRPVVRRVHRAGRTEGIRGVVLVDFHRRHGLVAGTGPQSTATIATGFERRKWREGRQNIAGYLARRGSRAPFTHTTQEDDSGGWVPRKRPSDPCLPC